MNWMSLGAAGLAALCLYLASPHQRLLARTTCASCAPWFLRAGGLALFAFAVLLASADYGLWCGVFIAASGAMLGLVAMPFLDLWRRTRHVG